MWSGRHSMNVEVRGQCTGASCFFPSAVGAPGTELRSSGLLAGLYPRIMFYLGRPLGKFIIDDCILNTEPSLSFPSALLLSLSLLLLV